MLANSEPPFEIATNIIKFLNRNSPHSYSIEYKRNDFSLEIKDINMIVTPTSFDIVDETILPVIIYHKVSISFCFIGVITVNKEKDITKQMSFMRKGLVANANYNLISLSSRKDESYEIKEMLLSSLSIDLDDIGDYVYFKSIYENDMHR